ncbi:bestrophin family ion channel [Nibrella viscosa]|uniref:Bestrophin family ion channel n=1 Tax=Nibrella viscosa TaxID=1084524 RepID=A0ABP8JXA7_9BACT
MLLDKNIPIRYILTSVKYDLLIVLLVSLLTYYLTEKSHRYLPEMPLSIPVFLGTAISILLSFKMNQSYDRWWEARKVWGAIVNDSRSLVIQMQSFFGQDEREVIRRIAYRQIAWCYSLGRSLRGLNPQEGIGHLLSEEDQQEVGRHLNKPLAMLQLNALEIRALRQRDEIDVFTHVHLDKTLVRLCDSMGKAERINGTIFPSTYRQFLHFIIYLFVVTLSISLQDVEPYFKIPLLLVIALAFFMIEKSAYHLQDPFRNRPSDVSVTAIAITIDINIRQLLGEQKVPEAAQPSAFYIL